MASFGIGTGECFSGTRTLDLLRKRVEGFKKGSKQNVALVGRERLGKSALLLDFYRELLDASEIIPLYLQLREEPLQLLEKRFAGSLIHCAGRGGAEKNLAEACPRLWESISSLGKSSRKTQEQAIKSIFDSAGLLQQETGKRVVFILDEFQKLSWFRIKNPFAMLGEKIMTQREVMYIVASSTPKRAADLLDNDLAMLFGNFETHLLAPPDVKDSLACLGRSLPGIEIPDEISGFLLCVTGRHPLYMRSIARDMRHICTLGGVNAVTPEIAAKALAGQLCGPDAPVCRHMLEKINSVVDPRSLKDIEILLAVASGSKKSPEIAKSISKSASNTTKKLEKFLNADILVKMGQIYDYSDPLLKLWMRMVYGKRLNSSNPIDAGGGFDGAKDGILDVLELFASSCRVELSERLRGLFGLFENDQIELAGRAVRFPKFRSVGPKGDGESEIPVFASAGRAKVWAADYARETVGEQHMTRYLKKLSRLPKTGVKIFLCCNGIEADAKLLAKEKEIWLWTIQDLNALCEIYEQPKFIV